MATVVTQISNNSNLILTGSASSLVPFKDMVRNFGQPEDYIELHIADPTDKVLYTISPFKNFKIPSGGDGTTYPNSITVQSVQVNPAEDASNFGLTNGTYHFTYNIFRAKGDLSPNRSFFIKEISPDRKELRLVNNTISTFTLEQNILSFIDERKNLTYFKEFYLNFGRNNVIPAVNITYDPGTVGAVAGSLRPPSVLIKLLNPLPLTYTVNALLSIVDKISNSPTFRVAIEQDIIPPVLPTLRGPNFDLDLDNLRVGPTPYYNFNQVTTFNGSFAPQIQQLLGQLSASNFSINVNYDDYENFVHFSSAARRLEGFRYKLIQIEGTSSLKTSASISDSLIAQLDVQKYQNSIDSIIQSFDGWEQYLYYETGSYSWPKQNSTKPYIVQSYTSSEAVTWYSGNYSSASLYDDNNQNYLLYALPSYIYENNDNELAFKFVASIGQMFDDVWIHIKAISDLYQSKNALTQGISKDIVYFALQSMGIDVYTDEDGNNVFQYIYGVNDDGSYKPITGSYETLVSASNYQISGQDQQKGIYKRLYHNLPLLLKAKGTNRFVQYLNTIFGIPSTVMGYLEYGGVDKITSSFEYEYDRFTYGLNVSGSNNITVPWNYTSQSAERTTYTDIVPNGIEFRFKAAVTGSPVTQSLFYSGSNLSLNLLYTKTGSSDSIYSGSIGEFGYLDFRLGTEYVTSSTIPIFTTGSNKDTNWYSVIVQRRIPDLRLNQTSSAQQIYDIYIKNNVWGEIGHVASASLDTDEGVRVRGSINSLWYKQGNIKFGGGTFPFTGSYQEIRLWSNYISESVFDSHVLNPESIEGNFTTSSFEDLTARWPLGNNLFTYNHNTVTSVASVASDQYIQSWTASFANFPNRNNYSSFTETYYADAANSGYANPVTDKVRIYSGSEYGTQLLPNKSIEIQPNIPITKDIHLFDASLSPQDEIDRNIISQFGSTYSIDDIIGNPSTGSYNELQSLQADFFKKFNTKYNYKDFIRLISFFHNQLFRTLKDFTPARTNLSTGIVIKPHLLERPVIYRSEPTFTYFDASASIDTAFISASNGGNYSQSLYTITYSTPSGLVDKTSDARDFFVGVLPGLTIQVDLEQENPFKYVSSTLLTSYSQSIWNYNYNPLLNNVSSSRLSAIRKKSEYITSGSRLVQVLSTASLQDFTYTYYRHNRPRYIGSQTNSNNYNFFNSDDNVFKIAHIGSYGKSAAIDKNTTQFAFFSEAVCTGSFQLGFPDLTNVYIKYLIDDKSTLTELSNKKYNLVSDPEFYNLYQVQNIFKEGESANISLFDNQNPNNQKELDGNKTIRLGGFSLYPILWKLSNYHLTYSKPTSGFVSSDFLNAANWRTKYNDIGVKLIPATTIIKGDVWYYLPNTLPYDITVKVKIDLKNANSLLGSGKSTIYTELVVPKTISGGSNYSGSFRVDVSGFKELDGSVSILTGFSTAVTIADVKPANGLVDSQTVFSATDTTPFLIVNEFDKRIITCSQNLSKFYDASDEILFFSGSNLLPNNPANVFTSSINAVLSTYNALCPPEYSIIFSPGDIVRFDSTESLVTTKFKDINEYVIVSVNDSGKFPNGDRLVTFTLDKLVSDNITSSNSTFGSIISRYIFAKKLPDETNIIVKHPKQPGLTSSGIIKNRNLSLSVDNKLAGIVSELKSKIFSTVLIP
jgi:hypothetical protein